MYITNHHTVLVIFPVNIHYRYEYWYWFMIFTSHEMVSLTIRKVHVRWRSVYCISIDLFGIGNRVIVGGDIFFPFLYISLLDSIIFKTKISYRTRITWLVFTINFTFGSGYIIHFRIVIASCVVEFNALSCNEGKYFEIP